MTHAAAAADQHAALGMPAVPLRAFNRTHHPEAQWFGSAGLGLFIHWGIAAVHGNIDLSWGMMAGTTYDSAAGGGNKLPPLQYWKLAERFNPQRYDPDRWLSAAASAGMTYAVFTTMHHDGYTMWPTAHGDLGVQTHLGGRDLVGPFVEACRRHGLKVGLYYSPPDWWFDRPYMSFHYGSQQADRFPGRPHFDVNHQPCPAPPPKPCAHIARWRETWLARVEELLTRYGRIDLIWFDGGGNDNEIRDRCRQLQPHIVINARSCDGDYDCTECMLPAQRFTGWFETPHCWQSSTLIDPRSGNTCDFWGYLRQETYKSTGWMLGMLAHLRTWGGNLLINVGPRPDGALPDVVYDRLHQTAQWMRHSRESVIGSGPGPYPERCNVPVTTRDAEQTWYLHLLPEHRGPVVLHPPARHAQAFLMRTGQPLALRDDPPRLVLEVPESQRTDLDDVVAVRWH